MGQIIGLATQGPFGVYKAANRRKMSNRNFDFLFEMVTHIYSQLEQRWLKNKILWHVATEMSFPRRSLTRNFLIAKKFGAELSAVGENSTFVIP